MRHAGDFGVLLGDAFPGVDHDQAHVGALNGQLRAHDREFFDSVVHAGLAPDAGGVDEHVFSVFVLKAGVHGVPGGARHIRHDHALFA